MRTRLPIERLRTPGGALALLILVVLAVDLWWLAADSALPLYDSGRWLGHAADWSALIASGDWLAPYNQFIQMPPLVHWIGALTMAVTGVDDDAAIAVIDVLFVTGLIAGCYGIARRSFGPTAGLLAAVFAAGTPMAISQAHAFMLDLPTASLVAMSVWMLVESDRLRRPGFAALAGLCLALGMLTRPNFPLWVAGFVVVFLARGAWRNWRGGVAAVVPVLVIALPWYVKHYDALRYNQVGATAGTEGHSSSGPGLTSVVYDLAPPRGSGTNITWYGWSLVNHTLFLPLTLLFLLGAGLAVWRFARTRLPGDVTPELVAGGLVGLLLQTFWLTLKDPRYTLYGLPYVAALAAGWLAWTPHRGRRIAGMAAIGGLALVNFVAINFTSFQPIDVELPGAPQPPSPPGHRLLTILKPTGYSYGRPSDESGGLLDVMEAARRDGAERVWFAGMEDSYLWFNASGLGFFARKAGLAPQGSAELHEERDVSLIRRFPAPGLPEPCLRLEDGSGVYVVLGQQWRLPLGEVRRYCPAGD